MNHFDSDIWNVICLVDQPFVANGKLIKNLTWAFKLFVLCAWRVILRRM